MDDHNRPIGYVDGSVDCTTQRFEVTLEEDAVVQLDDLLVATQQLADQRVLTHYAIVVEGSNMIEGATHASDTRRITGTKTMPGERVRKVAAQVLRTDPELWIPALAGTEVRIARGDDRRKALFQDQMRGRELKVGLDHADQPVSIDWSFLNGEHGAHMSISGISGVATKTSYALFALYQLLETDDGRALLGQNLSATRSVVFNVKGQDLLHIDRPNVKFKDDRRAKEMWAALGVRDPKPFESVKILVPPSRAGGDIATAHVNGRRDDEYTIFGWTPLEFVRRGLIQFVFSDAREQNQISFVVDHIRAALVRHAVPSAHTKGAVIMREHPIHQGRDFERAAEQLRSTPPGQAQGDVEIKDFSDLVSFLIEKIDTDVANVWVPKTQGGTNDAFLRRLMAMSKRLGHLIRCDIAPVGLDQHVNVIDINALHEDAQRFVVGAVLDQVWQEKQTQGREPLKFIVLDELNKYAPREGRSPIKEILVDIAARGRSLGVILIGCQQNASRVEGAIVDNASIKVVGRIDAGHADEYRFLPSELRLRAARFRPGTMILDQPVVPAPIPIVFPFPPYATNLLEVDQRGTGDDANPVDRVMI
jgi:DNA helicase HerA-like ATPase